MELTKRLEAIASHVKPGSIVADVGTDHGYIPIYLVKKGLVKMAYAMDINSGPLLKAEQNILAHGLKDFIETILSDGLLELSNRDVDTVIIAGMGGMLIKKILEEAAPHLKYIPNLILSPHLDVEAVRRTVHELGYCIEEEDFIKDEEKYYGILVCKHGQERYLTDLEYRYGKKLLFQKNQVYSTYLTDQMMGKESILKQLQSAATPASQLRYEKIRCELADLSEVIRCLSM
ncbi:MAG: SAM-dependent methyltransferase [Vallitaleaceae bacterium]|nr:SAM-dependent methyltransferase [Vallitaleaceae bacterium]